MKRLRPAFLELALVFSLLTVPALAQENPPAEQRRAEATREQAGAVTPLPSKAVTQHKIKIGTTDYAFTATAGVLAMKDQQGRVQAEVGYTAYVLDGIGDKRDANHASRPLTIAVNGGPGAASAYLNLLALGPWRLPFDGNCAGDQACLKAGGKRLSPSDPVQVVDNQESWLPFTDLVFLDPPGTGYGRVLGGDEARKRFYSVDGDIDLLSSAVARWVRENDRLASPKFFVGESYGGFRGPLLAEQLQTKQGIGLKALVLISPVLDFGWIFQSDYAAWAQAGLLPSFAAANLELQGKPYDPAARKATEDYASGAFLIDMMRGLQDEQAVARLNEKVAALTGLDPLLVKRMAGRIDMRTFQRERLRDSQQVMSAYDTLVRSPDPDPTGAFSRFDDPLLSAMTAPLTGAMVDLQRNRLNYKADDFQYQLLNNEVNRAWDWGRTRSRPAESMSALSRVLALDPNMKVILIHGATDLVTPYYTNRLLLNQLPNFGAVGRVQLEVLAGGHMFYSRDESRKQMTESMACEYGLLLKSGMATDDKKASTKPSGNACFR